MNFGTCSLHGLAADLICAEGSCRVQICSQCFSDHHRQTSHGLALVIGQASVGFFLKFTEYLIETVSAKLTALSSLGFQHIFSVNFDHSRLSFTPSSSQQITKVCITVLSNYIALLQNNKTYVMLNKDSLASLLNPQFMHDVASMFLESWHSAAKNLVEQVKNELARHYPYRFSYRNLKFDIQPDFLGTVESFKMKEMEPIREEAFITITQIDKLTSIRRISEHSNDGMIIQQIRAVSQSLKFVDSFQQILDSSFLNSDTSYNPKMILEESVETLSPRFLSQDALERQLEQLLIENERLKEENCHLRFQNKLLAEENRLLSQGKQ